MKLRRYIGISLLSISLLSSCELDLYPYDVIESTQSFNSVSDAKNWDNRFYSDLRGRVYGQYILSTDIQADQLNATADFGNNYGSVHRWTDLLADNYQLRDTWQGYYSALNNVNTAIEGFKTISPTNDKEEKDLAQYTGDAHFIRAYYYFLLNMRWAKSYNASTAGTDLSVPLVLTPDLNGMPARSTVAQVYAQILSDLEIAKANLADLTGEANSKRFNIDVVLAFESRVKLYMKDWSGAKAAAESLISGGRYNLYNTQEGVKSMWHADAGNEVIFAPFVSIDEGPNTNTGYLSLNQATQKFQPYYLPSQWVYDSYSSSDFRRNVYFLADAPIYMSGRDFRGILVNKYPGNPALYTGAATNYAHSQKIFRIAESYLNAAEAAFHLNDASTALSRLNTLRVARGLNALVGVTGATLLEEIKAERTREFAFEGFRLEDLKRWESGFTRRAPQNPELVQIGADFDSKSVGANDDKFTWGIPERDATVNPNIVQNPGW